MKNSKTGYRKYIIIFWSIFAIGVLGATTMFYMIAEGKLGEMPSFKELENPESLLASEVISRDNVTIGRYFRENRSFVTYEQLPVNLVNALLATEDVRFYDHSGIDLRGVVVR